MTLVIKISVVLIFVICFQIYRSLKSYFKPPPVPVLTEKWWGPGIAVHENREIVPFKINISEEVSLEIKCISIS